MACVLGVAWKLAEQPPDHVGVADLCVESGEITDFVEGLADAIYPAGSCYYMPSNTPMAAANLGEEDAVLIDTFVLPPGEDMITILEPGWDF